MASHDIDRRGFLRGAGILVTAAAATGLLGGCAAGQGSTSAATGASAVSDAGPSAAASSSASSAATQASVGSISMVGSTPGGSKVYATGDLSAAGLLKVYRALGFSPTGKVACKLHMGEEGNPYYLHPALLKDLVEETGATYVDCTVLYGKRSTAAGYASLAADHGFSPVDMLDADGGMALPIAGGAHLSSAEVGSHLADYGSVISVAHFKGHAMAGFGGTFKNLAIGLATISGKMSVHTSNFETGAPFIERVAEFAKGVFDYEAGHMACINVLNNLSVDCDCDGSPEAPTMADIGILASLDPVALDKASMDQIYNSADPGKQAVIDRIESRDGQHLPEYAESLGIGSQTYEIVMVD